jgi:hypothetical protein
LRGHSDVPTRSDGLDPAAEVCFRQTTIELHYRIDDDASDKRCRRVIFDSK